MGSRGTRSNPTPPAKAIFQFAFEFRFVSTIGHSGQVLSVRLVASLG
jgi:hypothetical protein